MVRGGAITEGIIFGLKKKKTPILPAIRKILGSIGKHKWAIFAGVGLSILSAIFALIGPQYLLEIADEVESGIGGSVDLEKIGYLSIILLVLYLTSMSLSVIEHYIIPRVSVLVSTELRSRMIRKIDRMPLGGLDSTRTGDIMSRLTNDTDTVGDNLGQSISMLLTAFTTMGGAFLMMAYTNLRLSLICCIPVAAGMLLLLFIIKKSQKYFRRQSVDMGAINGIVEETYYAMDVVRAYNGAPGALENFGEVNRDLMSSGFRARFMAGLMPRMMNFFNNIGYVIVCVAGSLMVADGDISIGVVVAFLVYVRQFTQPVSTISESLSMIQSVAASSERIFQVLDSEEMSDESACTEHLGRSRGEVEFRDVCFSYSTDAEVIHGFNLKVPADTKVAIVGPTGAGKTTVANLLMRFYELDSGEIDIDGVPTSKIPRDEIHRQFSMVLQDSWLFRGTIRENVVFTSDVKDDERVWEALRAVGIDDYVEERGGLDSPIDESDSLSAGQRQQLSIARAILRDAPIVILDEATSSVDTRTERHIQRAMDALMAGKTSFIIAHRLSTIRTADTILVMKEGRIVEHGTHDSLLAADGFYAELYKSQFRNCE